MEVIIYLDWTLEPGSSQIGKVVIKRKEVHHCPLKFKVQIPASALGRTGMPNPG